MGSSQSKPSATESQPSAHSLASFADDQDPFKQAVISTLDALAKERAAERKAAAKKEKALIAKIADLDAQNKQLSAKIATTAGSPIHQQLLARPPSRGSLGKKPSKRHRSYIDVKEEDIEIGVPGPGAAPAAPAARACQLTGSLAVLPTEVLEHILRLLHVEFHNFDRLNALGGITHPDSVLHPKPWNPVALQRVNRLFREIATPLFYSQIAIDSSRPQALTLLDMNYVAAGQSGDDLERDILSDLDGDPFMKAIRSNRNPFGTYSRSLTEERTFKPVVKRLVIFLRDDNARAHGSSFASTLESVEQHVGDKYGFMRRGPGRRAERHRPVEEVIVCTKGWGMPSFEVASRVTVIPREIGGDRNWSNGPATLFHIIERGSKPSERPSILGAGQSLQHLRIRLPKSVAPDPKSNQSHDLHQLRKHYHKLTYCRNVRLDLPFSISDDKIIEAIKGIVHSPAMAAAKHFYDGKRQKLTFGVLTEADAVELRKKIAEFNVEATVEVVVEVL